ncbi:hypothetical protein D9619_013620 [Psilocybe cf. subviscida]|uniref:Uncharacterized protein n=1 Tax=Psilocybe cf. subviscida TaxID=2480587 RepID=A0A8H5BRV2_9AGAR|nr:hypothetical protein D9619_013620 [Psilocybe cf. subviscida]
MMTLNGQRASEFCYSNLRRAVVDDKRFLRNPRNVGIDAPSSIKSPVRCNAPEILSILDGFPTRKEPFISDGLRDALLPFLYTCMSTATSSLNLLSGSLLDTISPGSNTAAPLCSQARDANSVFGRSHRRL